MRVLPWRTLELPTTLGPDEAARLFAQSIGEDRGFRGTRVDATHFRVSRIIDYKNSFLPVIDVAFEPRAAGATVHVRMRLNTVIAVFMIVWMTFATLAALVCLRFAITHHQPRTLIFGAIFPLAGGAMLAGGFGYEASRAETLLREMFSAEQ